VSERPTEPAPGDAVPPAAAPRDAIGPAEARGYALRLAEERDLACLADVELTAGRALFPTVGLVGPFLDRTKDPEELRRGREERRLWVVAVADGGSDRAVGFALAVILDGVPHLDELSVHPEHGRRGLGAALVSAVIEWADRFGDAGLTLSTFRDVPWNAPFYERLGFRVVAEPDLSPALRDLVAHEARAGLPMDRRVVMHRQAR
jgi:GNAT superfamily N-acetyltransferase